jgi:MraZ protein
VGDGIGFVGEHQHSLDDKGRIVLPARFRAPLQAGGAVLTGEVDGCLAVWRPEDFARRAAQIKELERTGPNGRKVARVFFALAAEVAVDGQGRFTIPPNLREFAGLEREVVVVGCVDRIEIWNAETWYGDQRPGGIAGLHDPDALAAPAPS